MMSGSSVDFKKLVLLGDSLTQSSFSDGGWGAKVADHLKRRVDVVNRGFSGYNSTWINLVTRKVFEPLGIVDAVTVFLGANDAALQSVCKQHVPLDQYKSNLEEIIAKLLHRKVPKDHVILVTPPPLIEKLWAQHCHSQGRETDRSAVVTAQYAEATREVAVATGVRLADLNRALESLSAVNNGEELERCYSDGLHLSPRGNVVLFKELAPVLDQVFSNLEDACFPDWTAVDSENPAASLLK